MGIFLLWATWAHEHTSETASNPEGVVCTTLSKSSWLSRGNQTTANPTGFLLDC